MFYENSIHWVELIAALLLSNNSFRPAAWEKFPRAFWRNNTGIAYIIVKSLVEFWFQTQFPESKWKFLRMEDQ